MSEPRWVQSVYSAQGKKWRVKAEHGSTWEVQGSEPLDGYQYDLPKSEYELCDPPEVWVNVTEQCEVGVIYTGISIGAAGITGSVATGYRLRKVLRIINGPALHSFIVEKRQP